MPSARRNFQFCIYNKLTDKANADASGFRCWILRRQVCKFSDVAADPEFLLHSVYCGTTTLPRSSLTFLVFLALTVTDGCSWVRIHVCCNFECSDLRKKAGFSLLWIMRSIIKHNWRSRGSQTAASRAVECLVLQCHQNPFFFSLLRCPWHCKISKVILANTFVSDPIRGRKSCASSFCSGSRYSSSEFIVSQSSMQISQVCSSPVTSSEEWDGFKYLSLQITMGSLLEPERRPICLGVHRFAKEWISERKKI